MKPKILDVYIAKKFISTLFFILALTAIVAVVFDISEKIENFLENHLTFKEIVFDYYINFIPTIINLISPLIIFISALYFTARLANNSEIISILAGGVSYYRLLLPYIAVALVIAAADYGMKNYIVPRAYSKQVAFELKYVDKGYNYDKKNIHRQLDEHTYFFAKSIDYNLNRAYGFSVEKFDGQELTYKLRAMDAYYDTTNGNWLAHNYIIREINGMHEKLIRGDSIRVDIPISIEEFGMKLKSMPAMTTPELNKFIAKEKFRGESQVSFYFIEKYQRTSMPFSIIILVVIAVTIATRKIRGGLGTHLLIGILLAISYILFMRFSTTFATNGNLSPLLSVWIPNFFYAALAVFLLIKTPK